MNRLLHFTLIFSILVAFITPARSQTKLQDIKQSDLDTLFRIFPRVNGKIEIEKVIYLDSMYPKSVLYRNAKLFFANSFNNAKDVIQYDDSAEGRIVGNGSFKVEAEQLQFLTLTSEERHVTFTLEIYCKDGRYRYRLYDFMSNYLRIVHGNAYKPDDTYYNTPRISGHWVS